MLTSDTHTLQQFLRRGSGTAESEMITIRFAGWISGSVEQIGDFCNPNPVQHFH